MMLARYGRFDFFVWPTVLVSLRAHELKTNGKDLFMIEQSETHLITTYILEGSQADIVNIVNTLYFACITLAHKHVPMVD